MGAAASSTAFSKVVDSQRSDIFATPRERAAFEKLVGNAPVPREDAAYQVVFSVPKPLTQLSQAQIEYLNREYGATIGASFARSFHTHVTRDACSRARVLTPCLTAMHS